MDLRSGDISRVVLRPNVRQDMEAFKLSSAMLNVLAALDGYRDVSDVVEMLGMGWGEIRQVLIKLQDRDLIALVKEREQALSSRFFEILEERLAAYMGPVAGMLIDDTVQSMGEKKGQFPSRRAVELVDSLAGEISSVGKKQEFRRSLDEILEQFT
ncbi:MAG: hypothetical protein K9K39_01865 [Desulfohalobiaceae bacterium]|nr:hypothetical protein [Desulfohalobiaceae bacterium]